jgi:hypothetical protein
MLNSSACGAVPPRLRAARRILCWCDGELPPSPPPLLRARSICSMRVFTALGSGVIFCFFFFCLLDKQQSSATVHVFSPRT